ncbi:MAG: hypothetical protein M0R47_16795 [Methylobacter sp.]|uniref:hypothetical protein n=1 Tax=Methylobacter sp. TaxID=2051955 RepID=UPI0025FB951A|nr:hypothetical protein [Methylobacter sp.]MCK9622181.1 hypothetical protein [Methylobacter sp.]
MTKSEKLQMLEAWKAAHDDIESKFDELGKLFNDITRPLFDAAWRTFSNYTKLVSAQLGDEFESLEWYWMENQFGKREFEAGADGEKRSICDFEDLLWLIEVCK